MRTDPWTKIDRSGGPDACWLWQASCQSAGYGQVMVDGRAWLVHRWVYEQEIGPIPAGHEVDHLCHDDTCDQPGSSCPHRRCANPRHLAAVPGRLNLARSSAVGAKVQRTGMCWSGRHPMTGDNLITRPDGSHLCRACKREREARRTKKPRQPKGRP